MMHQKVSTLDTTNDLLPLAHLLDFLPLVSQSVLPHYLRVRQYSDCLTTNDRQKVVNLSRILSPHQYCPVAPQKVLGDC